MSLVFCILPSQGWVPRVLLLWHLFLCIGVSLVWMRPRLPLHVCLPFYFVLFLLTVVAPLEMSHSSLSDITLSHHQVTCLGTQGISLAYFSLFPGVAFISYINILRNEEIYLFPLNYLYTCAFLVLTPTHCGLSYTVGIFVFFHCILIYKM